MFFAHDILGLPDASRFDPGKAFYPVLAKEIVEELFQTFNPRPMTEKDALILLDNLFHN